MPGETEGPKDESTDGQKEGQTLFYRSFLAITGGPNSVLNLVYHFAELQNKIQIQNIQLLILYMDGHEFLINLDNVLLCLVSYFNKSRTFLYCFIILLA